MKNPVHFFSTGPGRLYFCTKETGKLEEIRETRVEKAETDTGRRPEKAAYSADYSAVAIALDCSLLEAAKTKVFANQLKDIIDYKTIEYITGANIANLSEE